MSDLNNLDLVLDIENKSKQALGTLKVLNVNNNIVEIQSNINGRRRKISVTSIDVKRTMEAAISFLVDEKSLSRIQNETGINRNVLASEFKIKLPQLCQAYKQSEEVRELLKPYSIYNYDELFKLMQDGLTRLQQNRAQNRRKVNHEKAASLVFEHGSVKKASKSANVCESNFRNKLPKSKLYRQVQKNIFERTKGDIYRIAIVSEYFINGESYSEIVRKLKDEHSIDASRTALRKDMEKRLLELYSLYENDEYIRTRIAECGIKSYEKLEKVFHDVAKELMFRETKNKLVAVKAEKKNRKTVEMSDYIIKEYNENGRIITLTELEKVFEGSKGTFATYLKGRLYVLDEKRYKKVMSIWALSNSYAVKNNNSFTNSIVGAGD